MSMPAPRSALALVLLCAALSPRPTGAREPHNARGTDQAFAAQVVIRQVQELEGDGGGLTAPGIQFGASVALDGDVAAVGAPSQDVAASGAGAVYVFRRSAGVWAEEARLTLPEPGGSVELGASVAIGGDTLLVGAPYCRVQGVDSAGAAYVFENDGAGWSFRAKLTAAVPAMGEEFGSAVAVLVDRLVVCAPLAETTVLGGGRCDVFARQGTGWALEQSLHASSETADGRFGTAVAVTGGTVVVGAPSQVVGGQRDAGAAYVFSVSGSAWPEVASLSEPSPTAGDRFGAGVAVWEGIVVVGAPGSDVGAPGAGQAHVFALTGGVWSHQTVLGPANPREGQHFGTAVAATDAGLLVGSPGSSQLGVGPGSVAVFALVDQVWVPTQVLVGSGTGSVDGFGSAVAAAQGRALVGSPWANVRGEGSGAATVFGLAGSEWEETDQLAGRGTGFEDQFGYSLAADDDTIVVGARSDEHDGVLQAGAAYVFTRGESDWEPSAKLTAPDAREGDQFGYSVGVSRDTVVVGSWLADAAAVDSGALYVFVRESSAWVFQAKVVPSEAQASDFFGSSVTVDGDTVASSSAGGSLVFVFARSGQTWAEQAVLRPFARPAQPTYNTSVALSGDTLVASGREDPAGRSVYVYTRVGTTWSQQARLTHADAATSGSFGDPVAVDGDTVLVAAPHSNGGGDVASGLVYLFTRLGSSWAFAQRLESPDAVEGQQDHFGRSLGLGGGLVLVGAPLSSVEGQVTGAAYTFTRSGQSWVFEGRVEAQPAEVGSDFGFAVALTNGEPVVGAPLSAADDGTAAVGAAFVSLPGPPSPRRPTGRLRPLSHGLGAGGGGGR